MHEALSKTVEVAAQVESVVKKQRGSGSVLLHPDKVGIAVEATLTSGVAA